MVEQPAYLLIAGNRKVRETTTHSPLPEGGLAGASQGVGESLMPSKGGEEVRGANTVPWS
jgi:hypothetical protein